MSCASHLLRAHREAQVRSVRRAPEPPPSLLPTPCHAQKHLEMHESRRVTASRGASERAWTVPGQMGAEGLHRLPEGTHATPTPLQNPPGRSSGQWCGREDSNSSCLGSRNLAMCCGHVLYPCADCSADI